MYFEHMRKYDWHRSCFYRKTHSAVYCYPCFCNVAVVATNPCAYQCWTGPLEDLRGLYDVQRYEWISSLDGDALEPLVLFI